MKKEYITPEVLLRTVILEGFIAVSEELTEDPNPGGWDDQGAKSEGDSWINSSSDIWED
jgi:hypothetical protein